MVKGGWLIGIGMLVVSVVASVEMAQHPDPPLFLRLLASLGGVTSLLAFWQGFGDGRPQWIPGGAGLMRG